MMSRASARISVNGTLPEGVYAKDVILNIIHKLGVGGGRGYGYFWWTDDRRGLHSFAALGFGGQMVAVVPKLDLVVVVISDPAGEKVDLGRILFDRIVPAVRR